MEKLLFLSQRKAPRDFIGVSAISFGKNRLERAINWNFRSERLCKNTLLLQHLKKDLPQDGTSSYVSLVDFYFTENKLIDFAEEFHLGGGKIILLDEIHRYPTWSLELKLIYDNLPGLKVIFTSYFILEIYKGEADLSRRVVSYLLPELSLREFIQLERGSNLKHLLFLRF